MNFEELQKEWQDLSKKVASQQVLTDQLIMKMTQKDYSNAIRRITVAEYIGSVICFATAAFIIYKLPLFTSVESITAVTLILAILIVMPLLSIFSLRAFNKVDLAHMTPAEAFATHQQGKKRVASFQMLGLILSFLLMFLILPVFLTIQKGVDIFTIDFDWSGVWMSLPFGILFLILFIRVVTKQYRKYFKKATQTLEDWNDR